MAKSAFESARAALGGNTLTGGLEKLSTAEFIARYPEGVTLTGIDIVTWNDTTFPLCTFAEDPTKCFGGGLVLKQMVEGMLVDFEGDLTAMNESILRKPFNLQMFKAKSRAGRNYIAVRIRELQEVVIDG